MAVTLKEWENQHQSVAMQAWSLLACGTNDDDMPVQIRRNLQHDIVTCSIVLKKRAASASMATYTGMKFVITISSLYSVSILSVPSLCCHHHHSKITNCMQLKGAVCWHQIKQK